MKKLTIILFMLVGINFTYAQGCLPEGITFTTQEQIDDFQTDYPGCTKIEGKVSISGSNITNLLGLNVLTSIGGDLWICHNDSLSNLDGLNNLTWIGGDLNLGDYDQTGNSGNPSLNSISALSSLLSIDGNLEFSQNGLLTNLVGLDNLLSIGGKFSIVSCPINDMEGLGSLTSIGGELSLITTGLTNLTGLDNLITLGGLDIIGNNNLTDFTGLNSLNTINGSIFIGAGNPGFGNQSLVTLEGLDNVLPDSIDNLSIRCNFSLSTCAIQSICDYLADPNGVIIIENNAPGCNSQEEVQDSCWVAIEEHLIAQDVTINPNPFTTATTIEYELKQPSKVRITIYNHFGKQVFATAAKRQKQGEYSFTWQAGDLPSGVYFAVLKTDSGIQTVKMIKMK